MIKKIFEVFKEKRNIYENCVLCGIETFMEKEADIDLRINYIEGIGELCSNCHKKIENDANKSKI